MKKFIFGAAVAIVMALCMTGCEKSGERNGGSGAGGILESTWVKECAQYPFLKDFPSYDYNFQGNYMAINGSETYILADRAGTETKLNEYKGKFIKAGFAEKVGEYETSYIKKSQRGEWLASLSFESRVKTLTASYSFTPNK